MELTGITFVSTSSMWVLAATFLTSVLLHELGHWIVLNNSAKPAYIIFGRNAKGGVSLRTEGYGNTRNQVIMGIVLGLLMGALPYIIAGSFNNVWYIFSLFYILGIMGDLKKLIGLLLKKKASL